MGYVFNDKSLVSEIIFENGTRFLSPDDQKAIAYILSKVNIGFACIEVSNGSQNSLFHGVYICSNENLTSLMNGNFLTPDVYDTLKFVYKKIVESIKNGPVRIVRANKISLPSVIVKFETRKGHILAPIPDDLSDVQIEKYMDLLNAAIRSLTEDQISKRQLIAEFEPKLGKVILKTVLEYEKGQLSREDRQA